MTIAKALYDDALDDFGSVGSTLTTAVTSGTLSQSIINYAKNASNNVLDDVCVEVITVDTFAPTPAPSAVPTQLPTAAPTHPPTAVPSSSPSPLPSSLPIPAPSPAPPSSHAPTAAPSQMPTAAPSQPRKAAAVVAWYRAKLLLWLAFVVAAVLACCCYGLYLALGGGSKPAKVVEADATVVDPAVLKPDVVEVLLILPERHEEAEEEEKTTLPTPVPYRFMPPAVAVTADPQRSCQLSCMVLDEGNYGVYEFALRDMETQKAKAFGDIKFYT